MKIESGKYYRTRSGKKAFVAAVENPFCVSPYPAIGYIDCEHGCVRWTKLGYFCNQFSNHPHDLISEWKEPVTATWWLYMWSDNSTSLHAEPPSLPLSNLVAFKQVTITEGEGMQ